MVVITPPSHITEAQAQQATEADTREVSVWTDLVLLLSEIDERVKREEVRSG
jgi:hypothetical protein